MKDPVLNDEEAAVMADLEGLPQEEKIGILEDSLACETDESNARVLQGLLAKLKALPGVES